MVNDTGAFCNDFGAFWTNSVRLGRIAVRLGRISFLVFLGFFACQFVDTIFYEGSTFSSKIVVKIKFAAITVSAH